MGKLNLGAAQGVGLPVPPAVTIPTPFSVVPPAQARLKASTKAKEPKVPRLKGQAWFDLNFSKLESDVVQIQMFPDRKNGFHCPGCGIAGSRGIVIKGKDGRGDRIRIFELSKDKTMTVTGEITGFMVGYTCLKKYGGVDITKIAAPAPPAAG